MWERLTLIDLREDYHARELGFGIVRNGGMEQKDSYLDSISLVLRPKVLRAAHHTHITAMLGGHVFMRLLDQHLACSRSRHGKAWMS